MLPDILLTGSSGFLGREILNFLQDKHKVHTLSRTSGTYRLDLSKTKPIFSGGYELVIHAAGMAHLIPTKDEEKRKFDEINIQGTRNLLKGLEESGLPRNFVFISSVSVYGKESGSAISEDAPLLAKDPYGLSKIQAEALIQQWCTENNVVCSILRLPLVAGPNPPGNLKSMIRGIQKGYYFNIDGGRARKSIVLARDVAGIITRTAQTGGVFNLTDGCHPSFAELSAHIARQLGKKPSLNIPNWLAYLMARTGDLIGRRAPINSLKLRKLTSDLTFDDTKARTILGWNPEPVVQAFEIL